MVAVGLCCRPSLCREDVAGIVGVPGLFPCSKFGCVFEFGITGVVAPLLGNLCCHGNNFVPHSLRAGPEYEVDRITGYCVKAYFSCIHYVPV